MRRNFKLFSIIWMILLMDTSASRSQIGLQWEQLIPTHGRALALNPLNTNIMYVELADSLGVSYDGGKSWTRRGKLPLVEDKRQLIVNPIDTSAIFTAGENSGEGLWKSSDGGRTWRRVLPGISINGESIAYNPVHPDTMYVGDLLTTDFYVSADTGSTWILRSRITLEEFNLCSISPHPTLSNLILAAARGNIFRSTDGGLTWSEIELGLPPTFYNEIPKVVWDKQNTNIAYATISGGSGFSLFRSTDGGVTWRRTGLRNMSMWGMDVDPVNGEVYCGELGREGIYKSYDHGNSWQRIGNLLTQGFSFIWAMRIANSHIAYLVDGQGVKAMAPADLGKLVGTLIHPSNGNPVESASIIVEETGDSVIVENAGGKYTVALLPGVYTLRIQAGESVKRVPNVAFTSGMTNILDVVVAVSRRAPVFAHSYSLAQNYPNPFNAGTTIPVEVPANAGEFDVSIFNVQGQRITRLFKGTASPGEMRLRWDGKNASGESVASGIYFYSLKAGEAVSMRRKLALIK